MTVDLSLGLIKSPSEWHGALMGADLGDKTSPAFRSDTNPRISWSGCLG